MTLPQSLARTSMMVGKTVGKYRVVEKLDNDAFLVLRIDSDDVGRVVSALEERTGRTVERLGDRKDSK